MNYNRISGADAAAIGLAAILSSAAGLLAAWAPPIRYDGNPRTSPGYQYGRVACGWGNNSSVRTQEDCRDCCGNAARRGDIEYGELASCKRFCSQMIEL